MATIGERWKRAWSAFRNKDPATDQTEYEREYEFMQGLSSWTSGRPNHFRYTRGNERSIITSIYNRIALDVASVDIEHVRLDLENNERYLETINDSLNRVLTKDSNIDQTAFALKLDAVATMFDEGVVCIFPEKTDVDPRFNPTFEVRTARAGRITGWYEKAVKIEGWNAAQQRNDEIVLPKSAVCIIENPFYAVMNEPNSTLQRLIRKLNTLDAIDEQSSSGKLDMILQMPYTIKSETQKQRAEDRLRKIEDQLQGSKYGIAYVDATERITQLNRPVENNLMSQIEYLTSMLYSQLGLTDEIMNGTASPEVMQNYQKRTVGAILDAFTQEMTRKWISLTAQSQGQAVRWFTDPFKYTSPEKMADIADKFTRNEILEANTIRTSMGFRPSGEAKADTLRNANLNDPMAQVQAQMYAEGYPLEGEDGTGEIQNEV